MAERRGGRIGEWYGERIRQARETKDRVLRILRRKPTRRNDAERVDRR